MSVLPRAQTVEEQMVALFQPPTDGMSEDASKSIASLLTSVEERFLREERVISADSSGEVELASRFNNTSMVQEPSDPGLYMSEVVTSVVNDSVRCCAPTMIGHMTTSLPFYMRSLSKLVTTLHGILSFNSIQDIVWSIIILSKSPPHSLFHLRNQIFACYVDSQHS